jgi:cell division septation protein DedD
MRFEIRAGGTFLILVGLLGLSCVVFALGLVAGYEMARQTAPETVQQAAVYPMPSPSPASEASPQAAQAMNAPASTVATPALGSEKLAGSKPATTENPASSATRPALTAEGGPAAVAKAPAERVEATASPAAPGMAKPPTAESRVEGTSVAAPAKTTAKAKVKAPPPSPSEEEAVGGGEEAPPSSAAPPKPAYASSEPEPHLRKPYNIQINAAMDRANADAMASRLRRLGYNAFLVPTDINGQTWWRIRVGPYNSQEEAVQAEQRMREQYRATYAGH